MAGLALVCPPIETLRIQNITFLSSNSTSHNQSRRYSRLSPVSAFKLRKLPYDLNELEPHMSKETLEHHWGKHHRSYVEKLNAEIEGKELEKLGLEELVKVAYADGNPLPCFNSAAQVWNHDFFWDSMQSKGGSIPKGEIFELIERDFGSYENFISEFRKASLNLFGSGWIWLVAKPEPIVPDMYIEDVDSIHLSSLRLKIGKLCIESSSNALNPTIWGNIPLLCLDVWEHAYYIDYRNRRGEFIESFLSHLICWEKVQERLDRAKHFITFYEPHGMSVDEVLKEIDETEKLLVEAEEEETERRERKVLKSSVDDGYFKLEDDFENE